MKRLSPGSMMLFHNGAKNTPEALKRILHQLFSQGYKIVPVSKLIYNDGYTIDHSGKQIKNTSGVENSPDAENISNAEN